MPPTSPRCTTLRAPPSTAARRGDGPTLLEARIRRLGGHYVGDPEDYRSRDDRRSARSADPIARARERLELAGVDVAGFVHEVETSTVADLDEAFTAARAAPLPDPAESGAGCRCQLSTNRSSSSGRSSRRSATPWPTPCASIRRVVVLGEDVAGGAGQGPPLEGAMGGTFGATKGLLEEFGPLRVRDTPISEAGFVGAAVGAALAGLRPVVDLMWASFAPYAFDQIVNQAAKLRFMSGGQARIPLVLRMAAGAGLRAAAQHSDTFYALFTHVPGLKVCVPATPAEAQGLLLAAIADDNPVIFLEHMALYRDRGPVAGRSRAAAARATRRRPAR